MPPKRPATYSQSGPSRRPRQASPSSDEDDDDEYADGGPSQIQAQTQRGTQGRGGDGSGQKSNAGRKGMSEADIKAKAGQLVRFALFQEYKKNLIRRTDVVKHVIPNNTTAFNLVFDRAQQLMRDKLGCELYEVRARKKVGPDQPAGESNAAAANGDGAPTQSRKGKARAVNGNDGEEQDGEDGEDAAPTQRGRSAGTRIYTIRSILHPDLLAAAARPAPLPLGADADDAAEDSGALIQWEKGDGTASGHIALLGIRTVILAVVLTLGRVVSDDQLHAYLRRLNLQRDTILPYSSPDSKDPPLTLDRYLDLLAKQSYLEKVNLPPPPGNPEAATCEWRWGQRESEFSEKDAAKFIEQMMFRHDDDESSEEEEERDRPRGRNGEQRADKGVQREKLREDIAKAAGGTLVGTEWK